MNPFQRTIRVTSPFLMGFLSFLITALPARAQFVPGPYYFGSGAIGSYTSAYQSAAQQQAYTENRQMQMEGSLARSSAWMNINQSMQAQAAARSASTPDAGQAARDWMNQNASPGRSSSKPMTLPKSDVRVASVQQTPNVRVAEPKEIMLWPTLLKDRRFQEDRADVEAPFRRAAADGKPLTIEDYKGIIKSVDSIKGTVKSMESQIVETEYESVQKYLDDLITDAQKRIKARE
jgi:hypothetical protein